MATSNANQLLDVFIADNARGEGKEINGIKSKTIDEAASTLIRPNLNWATLKNTSENGTTHVTYAFNKGDGITFKNASELRSGYVDGLSRVSDVSKITFSEVKPDEIHDINVRYSLKDTGNSSTYPGVGTWTKYSYNIGENSYAFKVGIHEIAHSLGLAHPGDYNASGAATYKAYLEDVSYNTVMTYNVTGDQGDDRGWLGTYGVDDIAALQKLYGANTETRKTDTTYGFNSNTNDKVFSLLEGVDSLKVPYAIWDAGGNDTLDFSGFKQDQRITLRDGELSDVGGRHFSVGLAKGAIVENVIGGSGNDILIGNSSDNLIVGNSGNDTLYGAEGTDWLSGGEGSDTFVYRDKADSMLSSLGQNADGSAIISLADISLEKLIGRIDTILDFKSGEDKIDLSFLNKSDKHFQLVNDLPSQNGQVSLTYFDDSKTTLLTAHIDSTQSVPDFAVKIVGQVDFAHDVIV